MCYLFIYFYLYLTRRFTKKPSQDSSHDANMLKMHQLQQKIQALQQFIQNTNIYTHQRPHKKNIHISFTALMLFSSAAGMLNVFKLRSFCFSEERTRAEQSTEVNGAVSHIHHPALHIYPKQCEYIMFAQSRPTPASSTIT